MARKNKDDAEVTPDAVPVEPAAAVEDNTNTVVEAPSVPQDNTPPAQDQPPAAESALQDQPPASPEGPEPPKSAEATKAAAPPVKLGKLYRGDMFPAVKTPEMVEAERLEQEKHNHPDAVPLEVYFAIRGITDVGAQAARRRSTTVQQTTMEKWDEIFKASF